ncbi:hypothetical protein DVH24_029930 [Malus domestica]|uniref:Uncharacterized protein n=1 Tax=Malus domestica TaxID=3750 RepID=A0A498HX58_MALDO|nr:hypothetical protein DVH24_029930 [Malus domestica]
MEPDEETVSLHQRVGDVASMTGSRWADQKNNSGPVKTGTLTSSKFILISDHDCDYDFTVSH